MNPHHELLPIAHRQCGFRGILVPWGQELVMGLGRDPLVALLTSNHGGQVIDFECEALHKSNELRIVHCGRGRLIIRCIRGLAAPTKRSSVKR